jgi:hypothetical protein
MRQLLLFLLNLCLWSFLVDGLISLLDDSLILFFHVSALTSLRICVAIPACIMALLTYCLIGLTPWVPKRLFLPIVLFSLVGQLVPLPIMIYSFSRLQQAAWLCSLCQVVLGVLVLRFAQGAFRLRWSLVEEYALGIRGFSWRNSLGFLFANLFVGVPAVAVYLVACVAMAVGHFTGGFLKLKPEGLAVEARTYVRSDGKTIQLIPMAHVGDAEFYRKLNESFPTNAIILMEGVTDNRNLLTNRISYKRMANALGLTEQKTEFKPGHGEWVRADVDVQIFTKNTIDLLNLVMLFHSRGVNAETLPALLQYTPPANLQEEVWEDLLSKRNRHLLGEIDGHLALSKDLIVPWGAAHMPGIAEGIQNAGFRLDKTREFLIIRFGSRGKRSADNKAGTSASVRPELDVAAVLSEPSFATKL